MIQIRGTQVEVLVNDTAFQAPPLETLTKRPVWGLHLLNE